MKTILTLLILGASFSRADDKAIELRVAAAADLRGPFVPLIAAFESEKPKIKVTPIFGASGSLTTLISQGAPYDLFFSADMDYPRAVAKAGKGVGDVRAYGRGVLVLWTKLKNTGGLKALTNSSIKKIAFANPLHAPFGRAAKAALQKTEIWDSVQSKIVVAENVGQAAQFAAEGVVDAALISQTLTLAPALKGIGFVTEVPDVDYPPLIQGAIVLKGSHTRSAQEFLNYVTSPEGREILVKSGMAP